MGAHTHGITDPQHTHIRREGSGNGGGTTPAMRTLWAGVGDSASTTTMRTSGTGISINAATGTTGTGSELFGLGHTHPLSAAFIASPMDFAVQYVDLIIASKD